MSRTGAIVSGFLLLQISAAPAFAEQRSLLVGTWAIDVTKLAMPDPPKSVAMMLAYGGGGKYSMIVNIVDHDGSKRYGLSTFKPDGSPFPAYGNADYDIVSITMPSRGILVMGGAFRGHPANSRVFSLADDGKQMIETVVWHSPDGTPHTRVDIWTRSSSRQNIHGTIMFRVAPDQARDPQKEVEESKRICEAQGREFTLLNPPPHWSFSCEPRKRQPAQ